MDFVCRSIRDYKEACDKRGDHQCMRRSVTLDSCVIVLSACIDKTCKLEYNLDQVLDYVERCVRWIRSFRWSLDARVSKLTISLWLTPVRKMWCPTAGVNRIGPCEVNSGETSFPSSSARHIRVWRLEDWHKVVLHELLHAFNWDRLVPTDTGDTDGGGGADPLLSEAVVEAMATLLHCQLVGGSAGWRPALARERQWMMQQVALLQSNTWKPQQTSVYSYYMVKAALLHDDVALAQFARWIRSPTVAACQTSWTKLYQWAINRLPTIGSATTSAASCVSMRMVYHQLALNPSPIN